jgi:hypothetical protein
MANCSAHAEVDDALTAIDKEFQLHEDRVAITALHGLRGVCKTTLAAAYAERHRSSYRVTWWITAQIEPVLRADLVAIAILGSGAHEIRSQAVP